MLAFGKQIADNCTMNVNKKLTIVMKRCSLRSQSFKMKLWTKISFCRSVLPYLALAILAPILLCTDFVLKSNRVQAWFPPGRV